MLIEEPDSAAKQAIHEGLGAFNRSHPSYVPGDDLVISLRSDDGSIVGGVHGKARGPTLFIDILWINGEFRGRNLGAALLERMEAEGRARGARQAYLYSYDFQAPRFYQKHGYAVFGELPNFFEGVSCTWLRKDL